MIVALDANCLVAWASPRATARDDRARLEHLLETVAAAGGKLIIPTPGDKKGGRNEAWQRIKIDRQIVAVARLNQASLIVTNDTGLRASATTAGISVRRIDELPLPDSARQQSLLEHEDKLPKPKR